MPKDRENGYKSRSRSRSYRSRSRGRRYSRSRSRSRSRGHSPYYRNSRGDYDGRRRRDDYKEDYYDRRRSRSRSPLSARRRHMGNRDEPEPTKCLGVFGLNMVTSERDVQDMFSKYGSVESVQVVYDRRTGRSRGFAFVYFRSLDAAMEAKNKCNGSEMDGRRIRVDYSITQRAHTPTPGIYLGKPTDDDRVRRHRRSPSPYGYRDRRRSHSRSRSSRSSRGR